MLQTVIFGAGFHGKVILELLRDQGHFEILGFVDDSASSLGTTVADVPVLGGMEWIMANADRRIKAIVAIGSNDVRNIIGNKLRAYGIELINAIHPSAVVMASTTMGTGNMICAGAIVATGTHLGDDVIINTGATIGHDSMLHTGVQIAPGVHTAGCVNVGRGAFIGVGAVLGPGVKIGDRCIVGAGSLVLSDLPPHVIAYGAPAKAVRQLPDSVDWRRILTGR